MEWLKQRKLFFTNPGEKASVEEVWKTFKMHWKISDILLPNKRDRLGKRFGFVLAKNNGEASNILKNAGRITFNGVCIKLDWARRLKTQTPLKEPRNSKSRNDFILKHNQKEHHLSPALSTGKKQITNQGTKDKTILVEILEKAVKLTQQFS